MNGLSPTECVGWIYRNPVALPLAACVLVAIAAVFAATFGRAPTRARTVSGAALGLCCLLLATGALWLHRSAYAMWRLHSATLSADEYVGDGNAQQAAYAGESAVIHWTEVAPRLATSEGVEPLPPSRWYFERPGLGYPNVLSERECDAWLTYAASIIEDRIAQSREPDGRCSWLAATRRSFGDPLAGQVEVAATGFGWRAFHAYGWATELPRFPTVALALVFDRVEWRGTDGDWMPMLEQPFIHPCSSWHTDWPLSIAVAEDSGHAVQIRCTGAVVLASTRTTHTQRIPFAHVIQVNENGTRE